MKSIKVKGEKLVKSNINKIQNSINNSIINSLKFGGAVLRDKAISNLIDTSKNYGLSKDSESIIDKDRNWLIVEESRDTIKVECNSEHAAVVEFGGENTGTTLIKMKQGPGYPIGKQQLGSAMIGTKYPFKGRPVISKKFLIQQPKAYFRNAIDSPYVRESIKNKIKTNIRSVL